MKCRGDSQMARLRVLVPRSWVRFLLPLPLLLAAACSTYPGENLQGAAGIMEGKFSSCVDADGLPGFHGEIISGRESETASFTLESEDGTVITYDVNGTRGFTGQQLRAIVDQFQIEQQAGIASDTVAKLIRRFASMGVF